MLRSSAAHCRRRSPTAVAAHWEEQQPPLTAVMRRIETRALYLFCVGAPPVSGRHSLLFVCCRWLLFIGRWLLLVAVVATSCCLVARCCLVAVLDRETPAAIKLMLVSFCWETTEIKSLFSFYWCHISGLVLGLVRVFNWFASICICFTLFVGYKRMDSGTDLVSPEFESAELHVTRLSWALTPYIYIFGLFFKTKD